MKLNDAKNEMRGNNFMTKKDDVLKYPIVESDKRDLYLGFLDDAITKLHHKATKGKIKNPKNEKIKIDFFSEL